MMSAPSIVDRKKAGIFSPGGRIHRLPFLAVGIGLFAAKYIWDYSLATIGFEQPWSLAYYLPGTQFGLGFDAHYQAVPLYLTALLLSLPFVWVGVCLTVKRLRSANLPLWLAVLFFAPILNIVFFATLSVVPARTEGVPLVPLVRITQPGGPTRVSRTGAAWLSLLLTPVLGAALAALDVYQFGVYGFGLFVGLPFVLGMIAALILSFGGTRSAAPCVGVGVGGVLETAVLLLLTGAEGAICLVMAAPLWLACAALGGGVGFYLQQQTTSQREAALLILVIALVAPVMMGGEHALRSEAEVFKVQTAVVVDAEPQRVWDRVVAFPDLTPPMEWFFRLGVAYPVGASIHGNGVGAERRCKFSTGDFVEPIEVWDEPRLLRFTVASNPPPMQELGLYENVDPPHLHGFLESIRGQFLLTPLPDRQTLLEGTTWYRHNLQPAPYWRMWSDVIIHRIHLRVLRHVQALCASGQLTESKLVSTSPEPFGGPSP